MLCVNWVPLNRLIYSYCTIRSCSTYWTRTIWANWASLDYSFVLLRGITTWLQIFLGFICRCWWCGHLLEHVLLIATILLLCLNEFLLITILVVLYLVYHRLVIRVRNAYLLTRIYNILKVLSRVTRYMRKLWLACWACRVSGWHCQTIYITLQVLMHWTMAARRSRYPSCLYTTRVGNWCICHSGWRS